MFKCPGLILALCYGKSGSFILQIQRLMLLGKNLGGLEKGG
jgi:hypothetical protein